MKTDKEKMSQAFSPGIMAKALRTFDRAMLVVVLTCWGAALVMMAGALYTVNLSVVAKREATEAAAKEPDLPKIVTKPLEVTELQPLVDRLKKRFPEITFNLPRNEKNLSVTASSASHFRLWLTVLSYIDTISPQYRWKFKEFCVGMKCDRSTPMNAVLTAEKISFSVPDASKEKQ